MTAQGLPLRVLFLISDTGGGHRSVANAVCEQLERPDLPVESAIVDVFTGERTALVDRLMDSYSVMINRYRLLYALAFGVTNNRAVYRPLTRALSGPVRERIEALLVNERPDVLVSTHPLANWVSFRAQERLGLDIPMVVLMPEFQTVHCSWVEPEVSAYIVGTPVAKESLRRLGAPPERIVHAGMLVSQRFWEVAGPQEATREAIGLAPNTFTVFVFGGGDGLGRVSRVVTTIDESDLDVQIVVGCGRSRRLLRRLSQRRFRHPVKAMGFVDNIPELMHAADVVLTKGGPTSVAEAMAVGRPVIVTETLPGQESGNARFVEEWGAGFDGRNPRRLVRALRHLAADPDERAAMGQRARSMVNPDASRTAAEVVLRFADEYRHRATMPRSVRGARP